MGMTYHEEPDWREVEGKDNDSGGDVVPDLGGQLVYRGGEVDASVREGCGRDGSGLPGRGFI